MATKKSTRKSAENRPNSETNDEYRKITEYAKEEITWVRSAYKFTAVLITAIFAVGVFVTHQSLSDFKSDSREDIEALTAQILDRLAVSDRQAQNEIDRRLKALDSQVVVRLDSEFKKENIRTLIENQAKYRVDEIADPLIQEHISELIQPKINDMNQEISNMKHTLKKGIADVNTTLAELSTLSQFTAMVVRAQNDNRNAFDRIKEWAADPNFNLQIDAKKAYDDILDEHASSIYRTIKSPEWRDGIDPSKLSLDTLRKEFSSASVNNRIGLINYIWDREDFSKYERMEFIVDVLRNDESLRVVESAGRIFRSESEQRLKPLDVDQFVRWWQENEDRIRINQGSDPVKEN